MKMTMRIFGYSLFLFIFLLSGCKNEQIITSLPRSIPEAEGVSSQGIIDFLDAAAQSPHEFHSIMVLRHGKVIAEGWWNPYKPKLRHILYSTSKSFTATAIGLAVSEKRMSVNDAVISFFPESLPDTVSPFLSELKVKDLLSMSAGQEPDPTFKIVTNDSNWVKAFLAVSLPPAKVAGSYAWKDENTLELVLRYIESPHSETIVCKFDKDNLLMDIHYSNMPENVKTELKGVTKD
jgi:hypothetical protein